MEGWHCTEMVGNDLGSPVSILCDLRAGCAEAIDPTVRKGTIEENPINT